MVNFITGRLHSLLEKFNLQHSGWLKEKRKKDRKSGDAFISKLTSMQPLQTAPFEKEIFEKG